MRTCLCFVLVSLLVLWGVVQARADQAVDLQNLTERLEIIKQKMEKLRFCYNENCFYRQISSQIIPPTSPDGEWQATISAGIDRPSASPDTADYHFVFRDNRWQLVGGEEYTDVADYVFIGDRYEINSVHSSRTFTGNLATAQKQGNLKAGYVSLYYEILDHGRERLPN